MHQRISTHCVVVSEQPVKQYHMSFESVGDSRSRSQWRPVIMAELHGRADY